MRTPPPTTAPSRSRAVALLTALLTGMAILALPPAAAEPEGPVRLLSATAAGEPGDDQSSAPAISADGRYVTFASQASDLTDETNANLVGSGGDIYTYDRTTDELLLVSRNAAGTATGSGDSINPVMTPDGRYVAYSSRAPDLVAGQSGDNQNDPDIFVWDRQSGTTTLVSRAQGSSTTPCTAGAAGSLGPSITTDGRYVTFQSDCGDLTADNDDNDLQDVFLWDRTDGSVDHLTFRGTAANGFSQNPRINADGTHVVFSSTASNISAVPDDNGFPDVYLYVLAAGASTPISTHPVNGTTGNGPSFDGHISDDGQYISFRSDADDLASPQTDANNASDIFVFSVADARPSLVSHNTAGEPADGGSANARISPDGRYIAYETAATDVTDDTDTNGLTDVVLYARESSTATLVTRNAAGTDTGDGTSRISFTTFNPQKLSADGRYLVFQSEASDLVTGVSGTASNIYTYDRTTDTVALQSLAASGSGGGDDDSLQPVISRDGAAVAFTSEATNLRDPADGNGQRDVYARVGELDDESAISIADAMVEEGHSGTTPLEFVVTLSPAAAGTVTVDYATADGTATAPSDYAMASGTLTFMPGDTTETITVDIAGDTEPEPDETFTVTLSDPTGGATIDRATATGTIVDDDDEDEPVEVEDAREGFNDTIRIYRSGDPNSTRDVALRYSAATFGPDALAGTPAEVLLATDANFADALASGSLQTTASPEGMTTGGRPLLLTPTDELSESVRAELERLGAATVRILGGTVAISQEVEDELTTLGYTVERYAGPSRLETATDIATRLFPQATTAILARAFPAPDAGDETQAFADSLAAGAWAAAEGWPLLLTQTEVLSTSTRTYLESSSITTVRVVGGEAAIAETVLDELRALGLQVDRVAGPSRFDTALAIAAQRGYTSEADAPRVIVVDGQGPEAWAAGFAAAAYSALGDAPVLLGTADVIPGPTATFLGGSSPSFGVDESMITGPVLVCAIAGMRCDESRALLGLPDAASLVLDQDGQETPRGTTLGGTVQTSEEGVTLQPSGGCLPDIDPVSVPPTEDPVDFSLGLPDDAPLGPCDIAFRLAFSNGSVQTVITEVIVTG